MLGTFSGNALVVGPMCVNLVSCAEIEFTPRQRNDLTASVWPIRLVRARDICDEWESTAAYRKPSVCYETGRAWCILDYWNQS